MTHPGTSTRATLLADIDAEAALTASKTGRQVLSPRVRGAMERVPRDAFVAQEWRDMAWHNRPLPIGHGQTISQPFIVAIMTEMLDLGAQDRVLEIGTGCGYQTAVLAELSAHVYTVERIPDLTEAAQETLTGLGYGNIDYRTGDGHLGWQEHAPYDAILVTAAPSRLPPACVDQLRPGGRMIVPVSGSLGWFGQSLNLVTKDQQGTVNSKKILDVSFVPLVKGGP